MAFRKFYKVKEIPGFDENTGEVEVQATDMIEEIAFNPFRHMDLIVKNIIKNIHDTSLLAINVDLLEQIVKAKGLVDGSYDRKIEEINEELKRKIKDRNVFMRAFNLRRFELLYSYKEKAREQYKPVEVVGELKEPESGG